jgi:hypothetical protein
MNELAQADTSAPQELSPEVISALTGGTGFRYTSPDPC